MGDTRGSGLMWRGPDRISVCVFDAMVRAQRVSGSSKQIGASLLTKEIITVTLPYYSLFADHHGFASGDTGSGIRMELRAIGRQY